MSETSASATTSATTSATASADVTRSGQSDQHSDEVRAHADAICRGDRRALARAITLVESTRADHREQANALLSALPEPPAPSLRVGITGTPGVGKSTLIDAFGLHVCDVQQERVAVLAVDPSSTRTGGSILGDKTRMEQLSRHPRAFIRPTPSGGTLGGVARRTREAIRLVEAAGFGVVLVETVGVGQSETAVANMTDAFVLLVAPGGGDELQGVKRGIMELADVVVVNKCDGSLEPAARATQADYTSALRLMRANSSWTPRVTTTSALQGTGIDEIWSVLQELRALKTSSGEFEQRRTEQRSRWLWTELHERVIEAVRNDERAIAIDQDVRAGRRTVNSAVEELLLMLSKQQK